MIISHGHLIRPAVARDDYTLLKLSVLGSRRPVTRPALIGEQNGEPVAAIGLADDRVVSDPFSPSVQLAVTLRAVARRWRRA